ncbi:hypothetical protein NPIL_345811 [Nephila pilipes]|uniref:Uncharacterized protein n=1 Tax=Nephila pilipes TaxID=299642 RepID=A0A8X6N026_NEPPI|nr:hypothetical protein NPIL_345811 [Nephila pilipes]
MSYRKHLEVPNFGLALPKFRQVAKSILPIYWPSKQSACRNASMPASKLCQKPQINQPQPKPNLKQKRTGSLTKKPDSRKESQCL